MNPVLEANDIHVRYGHSVAVAGVSLAVAAGELLAIAGSNGAGKSTLVNAIAGWSRSSPHVEGTMRLSGRDMTGTSAQYRANLGVALVPESRGSFNSMTVQENLQTVRAQSSAGKSYAVDDIYALFPQLRDRRNQLVATLSGGERQMLSIGRSLRAAPTLLILDEPSVGLAPRLVIDILLHIKELAREGLAVLLVEQNVRAALEVADRLSLLDQGRFTATGTADEMREDERTVRAYLGGLRG